MNAKKEISDSDIDNILKVIKLPEKQLIITLGMAFLYECSPPGVKYRAAYFEMGQELWKALKYEFRCMLCDSGKPQNWLSELISGDTRNLIVAIATTFMSSYNVSIGIAVPAAEYVNGFETHLVHI